MKRLIPAFLFVLLALVLSIGVYNCSEEQPSVGDDDTVVADDDDTADDDTAVDDDTNVDDDIVDDDIVDDDTADDDTADDDIVDDDTGDDDTTNDLFFDDFDSYTVDQPPPSPWITQVTGAGSIEVVSVDKAGSGLGVELAGNNMSDYYSLSYDYGTALTGIVGLSLDANITSGNYTVFSLANPNIAGVYAYFNNGSLMSGTTVCTTLSLNQWYTITLLANTNAMTYAVLVNGGTTSCTSMPLNELATSLQVINFYKDAYGTSTVLIDNVHLFQL